MSIRGFKNHFYDSRVKAIAVLAPGLGELFDENSLLKINIPVFILEAEKDEIIKSYNMFIHRGDLPQSFQYAMLEGAGHYAFLPLCSDYIRNIEQKICYDPDVRRKILHNIIQQQILVFFNNIFIKSN